MPKPQVPKLRHANTMPTLCQHMLTLCTKQRVYPLFSQFFRMCWHSVGMPQLGHLRLRHSVLNIQGVKTYLPLLYIYILAKVLLNLCSQTDVIFNFRLFVKLGQGFDFPKGVFSRNKRICSYHLSQKANMSDRNR